MFNLTHSEYPERANGSLDRVRRSLTFVHVWNDSQCFHHDAMTASSKEMCELVKTTSSCSYYVEALNLLELFFCTYDMTWNSSVIAILIFFYLALYYLLFMITKYFGMPNYMTLLDLLPISDYTYGYVFFGFHLMTSDYLDFALKCAYGINSEASFRFSHFMGDILRFFIIGIMMLCINGYHVNGMLWWTNMFIIFIGFVYMNFIVVHNYKAFGAPDLLYSDAPLLTFNAFTFLTVFLLILTLALLLSYHSRSRRSSQPTSDAVSADEDLAQVSSDMDMQEQTPMHDELTLFQIWWRTVNGNLIMNEGYKVLNYLFIPVYFLLANIIPVMDKQRPMHGWCKTIIIFGFLVFPFYFIQTERGPKTFLMLLFISWFMAFIVLIAFHPLRQPGRFILFVYSSLGAAISNIIVFEINDEINNLTWQYMTMRFKMIGETICILFLSTGKGLWLVVLLYNLIQSNRQDAAFGAIMSVVTHNVYMALPLLVLHDCYTSKNYFVFTAKLENCYIFFLVIFFGVLLHVSMSSHEFRMSLFMYMIAMTTTFVLFEMATFYDWVHPFGALTFIKPPRDKILHWA